MFRPPGPLKTSSCHSLLHQTTVLSSVWIWPLKILIRGLVEHVLLLRLGFLARNIPTLEDIMLTALGEWEAVLRETSRLSLNGRMFS